MAVYVVTGGGGFIGSHIVEELIRRHETVKLIDNFSTGKRQNVVPFKNDAEIIETDIADAKNLADVLRGADYVIHQAAIPSVPKSIIDPVKSHHANVDGTLNLLVAARDAGVKRVVYASSSSLYGDSPTLPKHEGMIPNPLSPYGAQKLFGEMYCQVFTKAYGLETVSLRYFNVFGPRQDATSQYSGVLALFIPAVLQGRRPTIHGDGLQSRDFTYIENVVQANLQAARSKLGSGGVFNVGAGKTHALLEIIERLEEIMGKKLKLNHTPERAGDIRYSRAEISESERCLGYDPKGSFEEGLVRTAEYFGKQIAP